MNDDAIEQALRDEPEITPSLGFSHRVMRSVRHEADLRRAIPFPWKPFAAGLGITAALIAAGVLGGGGSTETILAAPPEHLITALGSLATTLTGVLGLTWWSLRFAGRS